MSAGLGRRVVVKESTFGNTNMSLCATLASKKRCSLVLEKLCSTKLFIVQLWHKFGGCVALKRDRPAAFS
eukprot:6490745-Amphidinium_carterae.4